MNSERFRTEQEDFWAGSFGDHYISRNQGEQIVASNLAFFSRSLVKADRIQSCIEFGANVGLNLHALKLLYPQQQQLAIEINPAAASELRKKLPESNVFESSILDFEVSNVLRWGGCDLALIKGVLIHINPEFLRVVYKKLFEVSRRYVLICEYYNPTPTAIDYRGHSERLFKRDFAGELLDLYPSLELVDYGFAYHRDRSFPQDDITWFLMEKG